MGGVLGRGKGVCVGRGGRTSSHTHLTHTPTHPYLPPIPPYTHQDVPDYEVQWRIEKQKPGNCAALIYTSGTTGQPKVTQYLVGHQL